MSSPSANKVAIVTGSSRGIGRAIAIRLAQDGHNVVINYQSNAAKAQEVVNEIHSHAAANKSSVRAIAVQGDVGFLDQGKKILQETLAAFGRVDIVVFNAAWIVMQSIEQVTEDSFEEAFRLNVKAPMFFAKEVIPHLHKGGRLILLSSTLTTMSTIGPNYFLYVATKGAIEQMTRVMAKDLGRKGITVNCVNPGPTDTDGFREGKTEQMVSAIASMNPQNRLGEPDEIAGIVSFLSGESSSWVNGQILRVNGGQAV
ncbi:3-oxoacyl-[acyl-carrier protein] reductase [Entomortierella parvispora]|uniref:3-oxoacyl-[acyl-carrier protein] reductase n=1 Tax=Entomortierella parvispora TaxID=205924 RepID=A0A9P3M079_9FUNG|nr:3-oxoacyl-[acyl-carrier protein] reductase [Entomortierella parvispora]